MASSLQTQTVYSSSTTEFMYHLLVTSAHAFSSTIMITFLPDILVKTKHWNQSAIDTPGPASMLMYNNFASFMLLICNPSYNITSSMDLLNNSPFLNDHRTPFLWTSLRNFYHSLCLTLSWSQLTSLPSRQSLSLPMTPLYPQTQHVYSCSIYFPNTVFLLVSPLTEVWSLCQTSFDLQTLLSTCSFTSLQAITLKVMDKPNT